MDISRFLASLVSSVAVVAATAATPVPERGKVVPKVECLADRSRSYALYLPTSFDPSHPWPVAVCLDPAGRGSVPVELLRPAAEKLGMVVVGSNDCRNGPWEPQQRAMDALWRDVESRWNPAPGDCVSVGFSGGARAALHLARSRPRVFGGVLACGGFYARSGDAPSKEQAYCLVAGTRDFNFAELTHADRELDAVGSPHGFLVFVGEHRWPSPEILGQALACLRGASPRMAADGRQSLAQDMLSAWESVVVSDPSIGYRRLRAVASFFAGTSAARDASSRAGTLGGQDAVRTELESELKYDATWERIRTSKDLDALLGIMAELKAQEDLGGTGALHAGRLLDLVAEPLQERGLIALEAGNQRDALRCMAAAADMRPRSALFAYNAACVNARLGKREEALAYLGKAADRGFKRADLARKDDDLKKIRSDPRFEAILIRMK